MSGPLKLAPWPPCGAITTVGLPIGPGVCAKHGLPQLVHTHPQAVFSIRVLAAAALALTAAGHAAVLSAGNLCCVIGDEGMERIHREIPAVWALRS